jgi:tRNA-2-methylthio-N6-dimethylallyladenosine synthase
MTRRDNPHRAYITIIEGCDKSCAYCVVPFTRGPERSRSSASVMAEARQLAAAGWTEIQLLGQNVNSYRDSTPAGWDFARLLEEVAGVAGIRRVRFTTSHPRDFVKQIVDAIERNETLCDMVHLPVQSGSTKVLAAMDRQYTRDEYMRRIEWMKNARRAIAISSDIIVGFPGETEADFQQTLDLAATGMFAQTYMYMYSPRRGTPASHWEPVAPEVQRERFARLDAITDANVRAYHDRKVGTTVRALIHGVSRKDPTRLAAKTTDNVTVHFPMIEIVPNLDEPWIDVRIDRAAVWGISGIAVGRARGWDAPARPIEAPVIDLVGMR